MKNILDLIYFLICEVENSVFFSIGSPRMKTLGYVVECWMETQLSLRRLHLGVSRSFRDIGVRIIQILNWCFIVSMDLVAAVAREKVQQFTFGGQRSATV